MNYLLFIISVWPFTFCESVVMLVFLYYLLVKKKTYVNRDFFILSLFAFLYAFSLSNNYQSSAAISFGMSLTYICMYLIGFWQSSSMEHKDNRNTVSVSKKTVVNLELEYMSLGLFLYGLLNIFATKQKGSWGNIIAETYDFWTGSVIVRTFFSTLFTASTALALFYFISGKKREKIIGVLLMCIGVVSSFSVGSRSMVLIVFGMIALCTLIYMASKYGTASSKMKLTVAIVAMIIVFYIMFLFDIGGINTFVKNSSLYQRFYLQNSLEKNLIDNSSRNIIILQVLANCFDYPFGGFQFLNGMSSHNTWIDVLRVSGFPGIIAFVVFEFSTVYKFLQNVKKVGFFDKRILLSSLLFIAINMNFYVESMFALNKILAYLFFLCCGCIAGTNNYLKGEVTDYENSSYYAD